jgi:hypothetical protein
MFRNTIEQVPMLIFSLIVVLCISYNAYKFFWLIICFASSIWLIFAFKQTNLSYKSILKFKNKNYK